MKFNNILLLWAVLAFYLGILFTVPMVRSILDPKRTAGAVILVGLVLSLLIAIAEKEHHYSWTLPIIISMMAVIPLAIFVGLLSSASEHTTEKLASEHVPTCSMYHPERNFDLWWESNKENYLEFNITKEEFLEFPFSNGLRSGNMLAKFQDIKPGHISVGDILLYERPDKENVITHRLVAIEPNRQRYLMLGDNADYVEYVPNDRIVGKVFESRLSNYFIFILKDGCDYLS